MRSTITWPSLGAGAVCGCAVYADPAHLDMCRVGEILAQRSPGRRESGAEMSRVGGNPHPPTFSTARSFRDLPHPIARRPYDRAMGLLRRHRTSAALAATVLAVAAATACSPEEEAEDNTGEVAESAEECAVEDLALFKPGRLTIGTDVPGLPAVVRGQRPVQRQGLRVGGRLRRGRGDGLHRRPGHLGQGAVQRPLPARAEGLRLRHQPDLDHARAGRARRLLRRLLLRGAGGHHDEGLAVRRRHASSRPRGRQARRPGRHHLARRDRDEDPARPRTRRSSTTPTPPTRRWRTARSTPSSPTCRARSTSPPRCSRTARIVGQFQPRAARPRSSACCSSRATRWSTASTRRSTPLTADGTLAQLEQRWLSDTVDVPVLS